MKKLCLFCNGPISTRRKRSARYCSDEHYYEAKKLRSNARYESTKGYYDRLAKNQKTLELAYIVQQFECSLDLRTLDGLGFDWGVSTDEVSDGKGRIFTMVGEQYAYHVDPETKKVQICKIT